MANVTKQTLPTYSIEGLSSLELSVVKACLSVAAAQKIHNNLIGTGLDLPTKRVTEIQNKLWKEVVE